MKKGWKEEAAELRREITANQVEVKAEMAANHDEFRADMASKKKERKEEAAATKTESDIRFIVTIGISLLSLAVELRPNAAGTPTPPSSLTPPRLPPPREKK